MEVVTEATEEKKEVQEPKSEQPDWLTELSKNMAKAEHLAKSIKEKILMPSFTVAKMQELTRTPYHECLGQIRFLASFGFVEKKKQGSVEIYRIVTDQKERAESLNKTIQELEFRKMYFTAMLELLTEVEPA